MKGEMRYIDTLTRAYLFEQHVTQQKSLGKIAKELGIDWKTVRSYAEYHNIPVTHPKNHFRRGPNHHGWKGCGLLSSSQYYNIGSNARQRNIQVEVTIEELWQLYQNQNNKCALSGRKINFSNGISHSTTASLDRKDPMKGYVIDNVWWVHIDINFAKQSLSTQQFIELCTDVVEYNRNA